MRKDNLQQKGILISTSVCYIAGVLWSGTIFRSVVINIIWTLSALISVLIKIVPNHMKLHVSKRYKGLVLWALLYMGICYASTYWAADSNLARNKAFLVFRILLTLLLFMYTYNDIDQLLKAIMYGGHGAALVFIIVNGLTLVIVKMKMGLRLGDAGLNGNVLGMAATISVLISLYFILDQGLKFSSLLCIPSLFIIAVSQSRKSIIALFIGIVMLLFLRSTKKNRFIINTGKFVLSIAVLLVAFYFLLNLPFMSFAKERFEGFIAYFSNTGPLKVDSSTYVRYQLKEYGRETIRNNLFAGVGLDNARLYNPYNLYLHDNYLEMFANLGIIGFGVYYSFYVMILICYIKNFDTKDHQFNLCFVLFAIILIMDYGRVTYYDLSQYFFLLVFWMKSQNLFERNKQQCLQNRRNSEENI